jgi:hypothetical protein
MLRWITLVVAVVVVTAVATYYTQSVTNSTKGPVMVSVNESTGPQPKVEITQPLLFDFGTLPEKTKHTHTWHVKNAGDADLEMRMISSTCSCTVAKLATKEGQEAPTVTVKPKETTTIDLEWDTKAAQQSPEYAKSATIGTNDPSTPSFTLNVKGKVFPPVVVYPPEMVVLNDLSNEDTTKATLAVFSMDRPETKVTKMTVSRPTLMSVKQTALTDVDRKHLRVVAGGYRLDLEVKPGMPQGRFQDELIIETDHPLQQQVKVTITGNAVGPIKVIPERVRKTDVKSRDGATIKMPLLVKGNRETTFEVVEKPDKIDVTITPNEKAKQKGSYFMSVIVPPGTPPGSVEGEIVLKTDHPRASEVRIPVTILISGGGH